MTKTYSSTGRSLGIIATCLLSTTLAIHPQKADALLLFTLRQLGDNKIEIISAGGTINTTGLQDATNFTSPGYSVIDPISSAFLVGTSNSDEVRIWGAIGNPFSSSPGGSFGQATGPFISNAQVPTDPSTAIIGIDPLSTVTTGFEQGVIYTSTSCLPNTSCTIAASRSLFDPGTSLDLNPGTFTWTWGSGNDQGIQLTIEPVPGPLPALGGAAAFAWSRRLRRRTRARRAGNADQPAA